MKNIVIAAGYATRLGELTKNFPKPLLKIGENTILGRMLDDIDRIPDIEEHVIITNHRFAPMFERWKKEEGRWKMEDGRGKMDDGRGKMDDGRGKMDDGRGKKEEGRWKKAITIVDDGTETNEKRLGAVCDLLFAMEKLQIDDDMLVVAADNLLFFSFQEFVDFAKEKQTSCIMCHEQPSIEKLQRTGVVELDEKMKVLGMEEKPQVPKSHWAVPPFYIYMKKDLDLVRHSVENGCGKDAPGNLAHYMVEHTTMHAWKMSAGKLPEGTLDWVCTQAEKARQAGKQVIAMMHHPLFPHISGADMFIETYTVADYETVRNSLANAGVKVILTGHFHVTDNAKDWNADKTAEIYDLNTGSTVSYPCDYRMLTLTLDGDNPSLRAKREKVTEVPSNADFQTLAENRLRASIEQKALSEISKKISSNPMFGLLVNEETRNKLAQLTGSVFIVHAEGDEDQSEVAAELKNKLGGLASLVRSLGFGDFNAMFNGVVENTSNYGTERAFQCADDDLSIDLPDLRESVTLAADGWASFSSTRDLTLPEDGLKGYIVTAISSTCATLQEVSEVPANTGFLLHGGNGETYCLTNATEALETLTDNLLLPSLEETEAPENAFVLACKNDNTGFYPVQQGVKIPAKKAYLIGNGSNAARMLSMDTNDGATGITSLAEESAPAAVYTLQGVRIAHPQKGINIKNGKLIMVK